MKIKREDLEQTLNTVYKCVSNNKLIPITQVIGIKSNKHGLILSATDATNYINGAVIFENNEEQEIDVCVNADMFTKLINKFTCEFIEIKLLDKSLEIIGDGEYQLELLPDDEGNNFKFPVKDVKEFENIQGIEIKVADIIDIKKHGEKALATTFENPSLINYYVGNEVIATDSLVMSINNINLLGDIKVIFKSKFIDLLINIPEKFILKIKEDKIIAISDKFVIFSFIGCSLEEYPVEAIKNLLESAQFEETAKIKVSALNAVLDRLSLFVTPYDDNAINLKFDDGKLYVTTLKSSGVEIIESSEITKSFTCGVDIEMLKTQLSSFDADVIELSFGNDNFIRITSGNVSKLIATINN